MTNPGSRWNNAEIIKGRLPPLKERITLHITLILAIHIHLKSTRIAKLIDHHRVVDHKINRIERIDQAIFEAPEVSSRRAFELSCPTWIGIKHPFYMQRNLGVICLEPCIWSSLLYTFVYRNGVGRYELTHQL